MKIKTLEFENFRNFKGNNCIHFSTDGRVTIIYGNNGDGKTTLHQLFQWAFYETVHFNRTASDKMYNLEFETEQEYGQTFEVWANIEFENNKEEYLLRRVWIYKKGLNDSRKIAAEFSVTKKDNDNNWNRLDDPNAVIEELLPSGLSEYFFFDGESMIADLRVKGQESATKLRQALYSILDLNILENAMLHIGSTETKTTALGRLYLSKGEAAGGNEIISLKAEIDNMQTILGKHEETLSQRKEEKERLREFVQTASERIGHTKSKHEYEVQRKHLKEQRESDLQLEKSEMQKFGKEIISCYPHLLISKNIASPRHQITLPKSNHTMISGISKRLVNALLDSETCVCGRALGEVERQHIRASLDKLPPNSYETSYNNFTTAANRWREAYDPSTLESYIVQMIQHRKNAEQRDREIQKLDSDEKGSDVSLQQLIDERQQAEQRIKALDVEIAKYSAEISKCEIYLRAKMKKYDVATEDLAASQLADRRITLLSAVKERFKEQLMHLASDYSHKLQFTLQSLLDQMLTSRRTVSVSADFSVRIYDTYNDESKSEGQFAVVSFAYIGGILKLLREEDTLHTKEYPLVLDGPFSKLGADHRKNVIETIPQYAPQIIIFSKDDLQNDFGNEQIGHVWTILSNEEKNVASVKEGFLW